MRRLLIVLIATLIATAAFAPAAGIGAATPTAQSDELECEYPLALTDATDEEITVEESPESIVALQPSDAQLIHEIGAEDRLVGMPVTQYTDHLDTPDGVEDVSADGDEVATPVAERVIDLDPDVVLAANAVLYEEGLVEQLRDAGLTVYVFDDPSSIDDVRGDVRLAGALTDECDGADETVDWMDERLAIVEEAVADEDHPLAYYVMSPGSAYTPGADTFQNEILETAGVENVAERAGISGWGEISGEVVVEEDPEWLIYHDDLEEPPSSEAVQATTAWQEEQFVTVDDNAMSQPGPHVVYVIEEIAETVHPGAYQAATGESADEDENENGSEGSSDGDDANEDSSIPGFGAVAALGSLLVAVGVASRRA